jgi:hypothetical protein
MRHAVNRRLSLLFSVALLMASGVVAHARDFEMGGDNEYPYSIMAPEPGTAAHHRATTRHYAPAHGPAKSLAKSSKRGSRFAARGSSGSVLPTPLPRTPLIPPEGGGTPAVHAPPQDQGPTILPSGRAIPNLPHGPETFQDRASRCAFQAGLYGVPNGATSRYMGTCVQ